jgi:uncharacterized protein
MVFIILVCILLAVFLQPVNKAYVRIDGKQFFVDVARTDEQKEKGLDIYNQLPLRRGMIFPFSTTDYFTFWMKGMKFPIDILYINENKVVDIFPEVPYPKTSSETPAIVKSGQKANYVLEINAGLSQKYHFKKGDDIEIHL